MCVRVSNLALIMVGSYPKPKEIRFKTTLAVTTLCSKRLKNGVFRMIKIVY
jgi:hypothetical protein